MRFSWIWTMILALAVLSAPTAWAADADQDGSTDAADNCPSVANPKQLDGDGDGLGNACDGDFNNDGKIDAIDEQMLQDALQDPSSAACPACDIDDSGAVTPVDYNLYGRMLRAAR